VFEWLIRCSQPFGRRAMLLEVIFQLLPRASALFHLVLVALRGRFMRSPPSLSHHGLHIAPLEMYHTVIQPPSARARVNPPRRCRMRCPRALASSLFLQFLLFLQRLVIFTTIVSTPPPRSPLIRDDRASPSRETSKFRQREN